MMDHPVLERPEVYQKAISKCFHAAAAPKCCNRTWRADVRAVAGKAYPSVANWHLHPARLVYLYGN